MVTRWRTAWALGGLVLVGALLAAATRYGLHRDELYFLACGRRPAWGYPDQPPLTPLVLDLASRLAPVPGSPLRHAALRLPGVAVAVAATVFAAALAAEFGGGRFARGLAAFAVGSGTFVLVSGHLVATSTLDFGIWVALSWIAARMLRTGERRWWLGYGAVLAVGLLNKQLPVLLTASLVAGILLTPAARPLLRGPWPWLGAAVAAVAWTPVLLWQARHGWPQLTLAGQIRHEYGQPGERIGFLVLQLVLFSLGATLLWLLGLRRLLRRGAARGASAGVDAGVAGPQPPALAALGRAWLVLLAILLLTAGQGYYPAGLYPVLIAAGAVAVEGWGRRRRLLVTAAVAASSALLLPAALPLLAPSTLAASPWAAVAEAQLEMVGWPALVHQVARARQALPPDQRQRAVVFTANYGEAGAVEEYGPALGIPGPAYSGHNGFAAWGPPERDGPVIVIWESDPAGEAPSRWFADCRGGEPVRTGVGNEEGRYAAVWTCSGPRGGWPAVWPELVHLSA